MSDARYCTSCKIVVASYEKQCPKCGMSPLATLVKGEITPGYTERTEKKLTTFGFVKQEHAKKTTPLKLWRPQKQL